MSNNPTFPSFGSTARSPYDPSADDEDWQSDAPAAPSRDTNAPDMMQYVPPMDRRRLFDQSLSDADMLAMQEQFMRSGAAPSATMFRRQQPSRSTQPSSTPKPIQHSNTSTTPAFERHPVDPAKLAALGIPTHSADEPIDRNDHAHPSKQLRRGAPTDDDDFDDEYDDMRTFSRSTGGEIAPSAILIRAPKPVGGIGRLENAKLAVSRDTIVNDRSVFRPVAKNATGEWEDGSEQQEMIFSGKSEIPDHNTTANVMQQSTTTTVDTGKIVAREKPRKNKIPESTVPPAPVTPSVDSDSDVEEADYRKVLGGLVPLLPSSTEAAKTNTADKTNTAAAKTITSAVHAHGPDCDHRGCCGPESHVNAASVSTGASAGTGISADAVTAMMSQMMGAVGEAIVERKRPPKKEKVVISMSEKEENSEKVEDSGSAHPDALVIRERPQKSLFKGRKQVASGGFPESVSVSSPALINTNNRDHLSESSTSTSQSKPSLFSQRRKNVIEDKNPNNILPTTAVTLDPSLFPQAGRKLTLFARQRLDQARAAAGLPPVPVDASGVVLESHRGHVSAPTVYSPETPAIEEPHRLQPIGGRYLASVASSTASSASSAATVRYTASAEAPLPAYTASQSTIGGVSGQEIAADADAVLSGMSEQEKSAAAAELLGSLSPQLIEALRKRRMERAAAAASAPSGNNLTTSSSTSSSAGSASNTQANEDASKLVVIDYTGSTATEDTLPHELVPQLHSRTAAGVKVVGEEVRPQLSDPIERKKAAWLLPVSEKENKLVGSGKKIPVDTTTTLPKALPSDSAATQRPFTDAADGVSERAALVDTGVPSSLSIDWTNWRVDLQGDLAVDSDERRELLHHGAQPGRPGYNLHELGQLARSTVATQRAMALNVFGKIIVRARAQMYISTVDGDDDNNNKMNKTENTEDDQEKARREGKDYSHLVLSYLFVRLQILPLVRGLLDDPTASVHAAAALCLLTLLEPVPGVYSGMLPQKSGKEKSGAKTQEDNVILPYTDAALSGIISPFEIPETFPTVSSNPTPPVYSLTDVRKVSSASTRPIAAAVVASQHMNSNLKDEGVLDKLETLRAKYVKSLGGKPRDDVDASDNEEDDEVGELGDKGNNEKKDDELELDQLATFDVVAALMPMSLLPRLRYLLASQLPLTDSVAPVANKNDNRDDKNNKPADHSSLHARISSTLSQQCVYLALLYCVAAHSPRAALLTHFTPHLYDMLSKMAIATSANVHVTIASDSATDDATSTSAASTAAMQASLLALLRARRTTWITGILSSIAAVEGSLAFAISDSAIPAMMHAAVARVSEDMENHMRRYPATVAESTGILAALRSAISVVRLLRVLVHAGTHTGEILSLTPHLIPLFASWPMHYEAMGTPVVPALKSLYAQLHAARLTLCTAVVALQETILGRGAHVYLVELDAQQQNSKNGDKNTKMAANALFSSAGASITLSHGAQSIEAVTNLLIQASQHNIGVSFTENPEIPEKYTFSCSPSPLLHLWTRGDSLLLAASLHYAASYLALIPTHSQFGAPALTAFDGKQTTSPVNKAKCAASGTTVDRDVDDSVLMQLARLQRTAAKLLQPILVESAVDTEKTTTICTISIGALHLGVSSWPLALQQAIETYMTALSVANPGITVAHSSSNDLMQTLLLLSRKDCAYSPGNSTFRSSFDNSDPTQVLSRLDFPSVPSTSPLRSSPTFNLAYQGTYTPTNSSSSSNTLSNASSSNDGTSDVSTWLQSDAHPLAVLATVLDLYEPSITQSTLRLLRACVEIDRLVACHTHGGVQVLFKNPADNNDKHADDTSGVDEDFVFSLSTSTVIDTSVDNDTPKDASLNFILKTTMDVETFISISETAILVSLGCPEALILPLLGDNQRKLSKLLSTPSLPFPDAAMTVTEATMNLQLLFLSPTAGSVMNLYNTLYSQSGKSKIPEISLHPTHPDAPLSLSYSITHNHMSSLAIAYSASYTAVPALLASGSIAEAQYLMTHVLNNVNYLSLLANQANTASGSLSSASTSLCTASPSTASPSTASPSTATVSSLYTAMSTLQKLMRAHSMASAPLLSWCVDADLLKKSPVTRALTAVELSIGYGSNAKLLSPLFVKEENANEENADDKINKSITPVDNAVITTSSSLTIRFPLVQPCLTNPADAATHHQQLRMHLRHLTQSVMASATNLPWTAALALQRCAAILVFDHGISGNHASLQYNAAQTILYSQKTQKSGILGPIIPNPSYFPVSSPIALFVPSARLSLALSPLTGVGHMGWAAASIRIMQELHQALQQKLETDKNKAITATQERESHLQQELEQVTYQLASSPPLPTPSTDNGSDTESPAVAQQRQRRMKLLNIMQGIKEEISVVQQQLQHYLAEMDAAKAQREEAQVVKLGNVLQAVNIMTFATLQGISSFTNRNIQASDATMCSSTATLLHSKDVPIPTNASSVSPSCQSAALLSSTLAPVSSTLSSSVLAISPSASSLPMPLAIRASLHTAALLVHLMGFTVYQHASIAPLLRATVAMAVSVSLLPEQGSVGVDVSGLPLTNLCLALGWRGPMSISGQSSLQALLSYSFMHSTLYSRFTEAVTAFAADSAGDPAFSYLLLAFAATHLPRDYRRYLWKHLIAASPRALTSMPLLVSSNGVVAGQQSNVAMHPFAGVSLQSLRNVETLSKETLSNETLHGVSMDLDAFKPQINEIASVLDAILSGYSAMTASVDFNTRISEKLMEISGTTDAQNLKLRSVPNIYLTLIARTTILSSILHDSPENDSTAVAISRDERASAPVWLARVAAALGPRALLDLILASDKSPYKLLAPLSSVSDAIAAANPTCTGVASLQSETLANMSDAVKTELLRRRRVLESALTCTSACGEAANNAHQALEATIAVLNKLV